jgi:predicted nucleic acid-binding protein
MILADTNLIIPLLVEHEHRDKALRLFQADADWHLPDWWQIELTNVLRNYHRAGLFTPDELTEIQHRASRLLPVANTHPVDLLETLRIACESNISAYDARFIALARSFGQKLVTEDGRLRKACPEDTLSITETLAAINDAPI